MTADGIHLFCEGRGNLDKDLLVRLINNHRLQVIVVPAGGKAAMKNFAKGRLGEDQKFICFRDRDFDRLPNDGNLIHAEGVYFSGRGCIENYFLDARMMYRFWEERVDSKVKSKYMTEALFDSWIQDAARSIRYRQAVEWTLYHVRALLPNGRWVDLPKGTAWDSVTSEEACLNQIESSLRLHEDEVKAGLSSDWKGKLHEYVCRFEDPLFYSDGQFHIWFHGKHIKNAMAKHVQQKIPRNENFFDDFMEWAVERVDLGQFKDLGSLVAQLRELS